MQRAVALLFQRIAACGVCSLLAVFFICPSIVHACGNEAKNPATQGIQVRAYDIPPHLTEEERSWFITFQEGNILSKGWQAITAELMEKTAPEQRAEQKIALANLGEKIGSEWCRPNAVRRVNSSMLKEWGDILHNTANHEPQQLASAIASINRELDAILD
nr:hypothetical protein [uncultured Desulfobulbus sp.]